MDSKLSEFDLDQVEKTGVEEAVVGPAKELCSLLLREALLADAHAIRLFRDASAPAGSDPDMTRTVAVDFQLNDEWRTAIRLPAFVLPGLTNELKLMAGIALDDLKSHQRGFRVRASGRGALLSLRVPAEGDADQNITVHFARDAAA